jgi:DNA-binding NarL/FixJ family response regulator
VSNDLIGPNRMQEALGISSRPRRPTILLADDHEILLDMLRHLLEPEFDVIAEVKDAAALLRLAPQLQPDIAVIDMNMPGATGLEAGRELHLKMPALKIVYLTMENNRNLAASAFSTGASAFLSKTCSATELQHAIRIVAGGGRYLTADIADGNVEELLVPLHSDFTTQLSNRELEVLQLLVSGLPMKSVARRLGITPRTVAFHKYRAMKMLGLKGNAELIDFAIQHGLLRSRPFTIPFNADGGDMVSRNR